jgi:beta-glucosidase
MPLQIRRANVLRHEMSGHRRNLRKALLAAVCVPFCLAVTGSAVAEKPVAVAASSSKVPSLLAQMTLTEKMALIRGAVEPAATNQGQPGWLAGVPRLGIPAVRLSDGPPGVLTRYPSAAQIATMALAATFSRADARDNGIIIADEANRLGIDVVLEPFINFARDMEFSRAYNTYGEDPVLTGVIGAEVITGIQSRGVMAQAKHFVGYDTNATDVNIDDQTLHEVYLAPFADAIKAGVSSMMCAYNKLNGPYSCGNDALLNGVLRQEMGFKGFVTSDWGAVHDYDYLAKGLDLEMPGLSAGGDPLGGHIKSYFGYTPAPHVEPPKAPFDVSAMFPGTIPEEPAEKYRFGGGHGESASAYRNLWDAMQDGTVSEAMIDRAAGRVLGQMERFGFLDGRHAVSAKTMSGLDIPAVIRRSGEDAAVLLKNADSILPLAADKSGSIALIGPGARQVVAIGKAGERSIGLPERQVGPYDALRHVMPGADLRLEVANDMNGTAVPAAVLSHDGKPGLVHKIADAPAGVDAAVNFTKTGKNALTVGTDHSWEGTLTVSEAGTYMLYAQTMGARSAIYVDGKKVAKGMGMKGGSMHGDTVQANQDSLLPTPDGLDNVRGAVALTAGAHSIRIVAEADTSGAPVEARLAWVTPSQQRANFDAAVAAAKAAKTAVVFVWSRSIPFFNFPGDQDKLVEAVAAVNPNTIVVLNVSQPIAMPWLSKVKGVVQMWWPGDEGGWATANILSGKKNPAGRLPFTWAAKLTDYAANDPAHPERNSAGVNGKTTFSEGLDVGYRWFDRQKIAPVYPFGYGLSYTNFAYSGLKLVKATDGGLNVSFTVKNTGAVEGDEVPQVYVSAPSKAPAGVAFASNALVGFDRVTLRAGEAKPVTIHVDRRRLQYWSTAQKRWIDAAAGRTLAVGASSRDVRLQASTK